MFLRSSIFRAISFKKTVFLPPSYWILVCLRFILSALPQRGYLHPDEFFQNVEIIAGDIFTVDVSKTWEFNPKFPIRNIFVPKAILGPPFHFIRIVNPYIKAYFNIDLKTPYFLLVIPRLFVCTLSLINDYCLYRICITYGQNFKNRLIIFASSYVVFIYSCRTFSNTLEMIFFSILLLLVAESMFKSDNVIYHSEFLQEKYDKATTPVEKVKILKIQKLIPYDSLTHVFLIANVVVVGLFNRPTFIAFAFPPLFFWLQRGIGSKVIGFKKFHLRIAVFILCSIPTAFFLILVDSAYYGYLTMADIESQKVSWENWVVTPFNFLKYNFDKKNLTWHGLHPWWYHVAVNVPLLFNVLGLLAFITLSINTYRFLRGQYSKLPRIQSITGLMLFSLATPVALLSLVPHQEARFIIPIFIPLVFLFGNHLHQNESDRPTSKKLKKTLLCIWYILNALQIIFYGFIHQGGVYPFTKTLHHEIKNTYGVHTYVITTHTYSIPTFLLQLESTNKIWKDKKTGHKYRLSPTLFLHKYGSLPMKGLFTKIDEVLSNAEMNLHEFQKKYRFYVVAPCSLEENIRTAAIKYHYINLVEEFSFYPHFCTEAIPKFPSKHDQFCFDSNLPPKNESQALDLSIFDRISCFLKKFCLRVYIVKPK